jgi:hypothetical protein
LDTQETYNRRQAVLDVVGHLPGQQGLIVERFLEFRVGGLTFDGDSHEPRKAGEKFGVGAVKLTEVGVVDLEHAERPAAFAATLDQDIDRAANSIDDEKLRRAESSLFLHVIGDYQLPGLKGVAGRRSDSRPGPDFVDRSWSPADAAAHQERSSSALYSWTLAKRVSRPSAHISVARSRIQARSRVFIAERPNSLSKDCWRNR